MFTLKYQVIFTAGYEIDAKNKKQAEEKAKLEFAKELIEEGAKRFLVDVIPLKG